MITKEMIKKGFENGTISIEDNTFCCDNICCRIGDNSFYFVEVEEQDLTTEEYLRLHSMDEIVERLYETLKDVESAEDCGLDVGEWEYYRAILM